MEKKRAFPAVVSVDWLLDNIDSTETKVVDASWFMPGSNRDGYQEWIAERIPGAVYFDFDGEIKDMDSPLPHMLPSEKSFSDAVGKLGISNGDTIIIYDSQGIFSAPRVWWMFKVMGHKNVAVLDGGLPAWKASGGRIDTSLPAENTSVTYRANLVPNRLITADELLGILDDPGFQVVDARPADRFYARQPEPRQGVRAGHMKNAINLPFSDLLENGSLIRRDSLNAKLTSILRSDTTIVTSCGSGVTACILALVIEHSLGRCCRVYDGSWSEWGGSSHLPVVTD
ncbi:rhodanese-like domain-containing protein [Parasalinivibrio latis]|uniref:sulfurtransferase n=1 Tax=Parasalinivibrio latis TaxID=2952610 RepID=UPI0030DE16E3